jgi:ABC-2 type transport system permease protein
MTTAPPVTPAAAPSVPGTRRRIRFGHLLASEWTKIRSVRSTVWTLLVFVVVTIGLCALFSWLTVTHWNGPHAATRDSNVASDPVSFVLGAGIGLGQLATCVLGVLVITTEYSTGVIHSSLLAVPRRLWMLAAKSVVLAALMIVVTEVIVFCSFFVGSAILHSRVAVSLSDSDVTRAVVGAGLYLTVLGLFSLGIGGIMRHSAAAITTAIGVVFVLPILSGLLPSSWGAHINAYLPEQAGSVITKAHAPASQLLSAWEGFGVLCIWTALVLAGAAWMIRYRDA